ncbi:uncharacterized mitochondrial protein AtMg00810-like [Capsicum annuum]|uniref:uncharacterized mitochondrial protein AtMg00810-like n=1 Tax=Capsicum annuum TaxID=4072 RepID=UPI001FB19A21|nr:uncharacterized mitochondrial protein AtMg00810-like [Capsicum annuum]
MDNILLAGSDVSEIINLKFFLDHQFKIKDLGLVHYFLGLEIISHDTGFLIHQHKYASDLLAEFSCSNYTPVASPLEPSVKLILSQFLQDPCAAHMKAGIHVLHYLLNAPDQGIFLPATSNFSICAYADSDWAACPLSRRSFTGYYIVLGGCPISWKSKKQPTIALSSAEA